MNSCALTFAVGLFLLLLVWIKNLSKLGKAKERSLLDTLKKIFSTGILTSKDLGKQIGLGFFVSLVVVSGSFFYEGITTEPFSILKLLYPAGEELIYRGGYIGGVLFLTQNVTPKQKKFLSIVLLVLSSVIFAGIHTTFIYHLMGSFAFGVAYLWGWKRNLVASTTAHVMSNLLILILPWLVF